MDEQERAAVAMQGTIVEARFENNLRVGLYSHPNFYAEVFYDSVNNRTVRCRAFTSIVPLTAYIKLN